MSGPILGTSLGLIGEVQYNSNGPQNGFANVAPGGAPLGSTQDGNGPWSVVQLLPGANIQLAGAGEYDLPSTARSPQLAIGLGNEVLVSGTRGSMQVDCVTGNGTGNQGLAYLVGNVSPATTLYLGLQLAAGNIPTVTITDSTGAVVATATGAAVANSLRVTFQLFWDSGLGTVVLTVNGQPSIATVVTPWSAFTPVSVLYGAVPSTFTGLSATFNGTFIKVQVSPRPGAAG
jgi:hypothetical protein